MAYLQDVYMNAYKNEFDSQSKDKQESGLKDYNHFMDFKHKLFKFHTRTADYFYLCQLEDKDKEEK